MTNFREYLRVVFTQVVRNDTIEQMFSIVRDIILLKEDGTIWITQKAMAELFGVDKSGISRHLSNIFKSDELDEQVVISKMETPTPHGAIPGKMQIIESDFDKIVKQIKANN